MAESNCNVRNPSMRRICQMLSRRHAMILLALALSLVGAVFGQRPFREYPGWEYDDFPKPPDWRTPAEWVFARLMYPSVRFSPDRPYTNWLFGAANWTIDYPRSDRHLSEAVRRLTRIHARSIEQPVNLDDGDDVYNWPWLYGVEVGHWDLTDAQAAKLRDFLLRGGFFMCDDFHGTWEWGVFIASMQRVFPDRPIVDIDNADQIFHSVYDINDKFVIPGAEHVREGSKNGGRVGRWVGVYDDKGRLMVVGNFNQDTGDSWEWADSPRYPVKFSDLGIRLGVNYVMYAMTH